MAVVQVRGRGTEETGLVPYCCELLTGRANMLDTDGLREFGLGCATISIGCTG